MKLNDFESSNENQISEMFAKFFQSTYSESQYQNQNYPFNIKQINNLNMPTITAPIVYKYLLEVKNSTQTGSDNIPGCILKKCAKILCHPLSTIFNLSILNGHFAKIWKISYILPLYKSGLKSDVTNYRGIASLSIISNVLEKIISDHLSFQLSSIISPYQHGFTKGRSTITNLLEFTNYKLM